MEKFRSQKSKIKSQNSKFQSFAISCFLLFPFYFLLSNVSAQSVSASLDRDKILLGEQVTLQLSLNNINEATSFVQSWPKVKDTINHTEIIKSNAIDTIRVDGRNTYHQNFIVTSFDSGRWQLGPFIFTVQDKVTGQKLQLKTAGLYITVLPVDVSSLKNYHPIKDVIDVKTSFNWLPVIIAAAVILLAVIIFIILKRRKKKIAEQPKVILKGTPLERALEKLQALQNETLISTSTIKKFHSEIDIITRQYFEEMMHVKALQLTVGEMFSRMNIYLQDAQLRRKFQQVFELNASVKFAKYMPAEEESRNTMEEIIRSLHQIDDLVNRSRNNAERLVPKY
jgi:hypothetical protein